MEEKIKRLLELFRKRPDILQPHAVRNDNGADSYHCRGCYQDEKVMGHAWGTDEISTHAPNCPYVEVRRILNSLEEEE